MKAGENQIFRMSNFVDFIKIFEFLLIYARFSKKFSLVPLADDAEILLTAGKKRI
jgi:hypothetical protein